MKLWTGASASIPQLRPLLDPISEHEIYRRFLKTIEWRLERTREAGDLAQAPAGAYGRTAEFAADLELIRESLSANGGQRIIDGELQDWLWQASVFGLHIARLDIRQESAWNKRVMAELLASAGITAEYASLPEEEKREVLHASMSHAGPVETAGLSAEARETTRLFSMLALASATIGAEALGGYIISMTHALSDVLAVLWLLTCRSLCARAGERGLVMDIIPLFETIRDLESAPHILTEMLDDPVVSRAPLPAGQCPDRHDRVFRQHEGRRLPCRLLGVVRGAEHAPCGGAKPRGPRHFFPRQGRLARARGRPGGPEHPFSPAGVPDRGAAHDRAGRSPGGPLR